MNEEELTKIVEKAVKASSKAKKTGKIVAICTAALLSMLAIFGIWIKLRRQGKELAKLKHEKNVNDEKLRQAEVNAELAKNEADFQSHIQEAQAHLNTVTDLENKITTIQQEHQRQTELIQSLVTWEDIDKYLDRGVR